MDKSVKNVSKSLHKQQAGITFVYDSENNIFTTGKHVKTR